MMKMRLQVFALLLLLAASGAAADSPDAAPAEIARYKSWTRMNETPILVESSWVGG